MARNVSRKKVLILGGIAFAVIVGAGALIYSAMSENVVFFYSPTQVAAGEAPHGPHVPCGRHGEEGYRGNVG